MNGYWKYYRSITHDFSRSIQTIFQKRAFSIYDQPTILIFNRVLLQLLRKLIFFHFLLLLFQITVATLGPGMNVHGREFQNFFLWGHGKWFWEGEGEERVVYSPSNRNSKRGAITSQANSISTFDWQRPIHRYCFAGNVSMIFGHGDGYPVATLFRSLFSVRSIRFIAISPIRFRFQAWSRNWPNVFLQLKSNQNFTWLTRKY